jgi:hypothetical protein
MNFSETPSAHQQIDHAAGRGASCFSQIGSRFHNYPGVGGRIRRDAFASLDYWTGERLLLMQIKAQRHIKRTLDAVNANLAIALGGMAIATTEERAAIVDRQIERGACAQLAHVEIATERARRTCAKGTVISTRHAHYAKEGPQRHYGRSH